jgi:hypothetical protein
VARGTFAFADHSEMVMALCRLPHLPDLIRSVPVEVVRVCFIAVRHHRSVERISGLSLDYSVTTLTYQFHISLLVGILYPASVAGAAIGMHRLQASAASGGRAA